jgi:SDR family mycofactocin-dependent oxidoreductase
MGKLDGQVAFITGAARGQGRSHALRLAEEGADIIAVDVCEAIDTVPYGLGTEEELAETASLVEDLDRRVVAQKADVRSLAALESAVAAGLTEFGHIDIVCANAGIASFAPAWELTEDQWMTMLDVNLNGVWRTLRSVVPSMIEAGRGGSIIVTSSNAGVRGIPNLAHYVSAKHGVLGLMRTLAAELAEHWIRVNAVLPSSTDTPMINNDAIYSLFNPGVENPTREMSLPGYQALNLLPVPMLEPRDISNAVLWLASDEARYVTGVALPVDAGSLAKPWG